MKNGPVVGSTQEVSKVDKFDLYHAIITRQFFFLFFFVFFYFFVIETTEQHTAIDLVNFVYYPTGFV